MINKNKKFENLSFNFSKLSNRIRIHSSLNNISKQLNNISLNDVNILNLKCGSKKTNSTNRKNTFTNKSHSRIYSSKSDRGKAILYKFNHFNYLDSFEIDTNFKIVNSDSFSITPDTNRNNENKLNLKKKNLILKENLKFLLNEVKKYKKNEQNNTQVKEYEKQMEYYINELDKYHKEINIMKEKLLSVIKENEELKEYINTELHNLNNSQLFNSICKTETNKPTLYKSNKINKLKSFKYLNLDLKNYLDKEKKLNTDKSINGKKTSRNKFKVNINNNNYLLIEDNNINNNSYKNITKNKNINNSEVFNLKIIKKINNKNLKSNNKYNLKKVNRNYINEVIFQRKDNNTKFLNSINKTLSKNRINQNCLKENLFEFNNPINLSQSFRYYKGKDYKSGRKIIFLNKNGNNISLNNHTYDEN